ncbi:unnamed protein product [Caenorhabditis bovis]|uniref:Uncharacterized protein n=1 Tax=Caenorhabditis bovis TaxID=2654633 RepID=A0A8S1ESD5_9PELO|nr:unnamed protein product [Caenorhabditis bovis]
MQFQNTLSGILNVLLVSLLFIAAMTHAEKSDDLEEMTNEEYVPPMPMENSAYWSGMPVRGLRSSSNGKPTFIRFGKRASPSFIRFGRK